MRRGLPPPTSPARGEGGAALHFETLSFACVKAFGTPIAAPASRQLSLSRQADCRLRPYDRRGIPFSGQRLRLRAVKAHRQVEGSLRCRKPIGFLVLSRTLVLEVDIERTVR